MIPIPVELHQREVRRQPWVSYAILLASVGLFLVLYLASLASNVPRKVQAAAADAEKYYSARPYLKMSPGFLQLVDEITRERMEAAHRTHRVPDGTPPAWERRLQQERFEALEDAVTVAAQRSPLLEYGFLPKQAAPLAVLAPMLLHLSWLHLILNLAIFYLTAPFLEDAFGRVLFALIYLTSGLAGMAIHTLGSGKGSGVLLGASAAIAGVMGAFVLRLGMSRIHFLWVPVPRFECRFSVPAFLTLPLWVAAQAWLSIHSAPTAGADLLGQAGGFGCGALLAIFIMATGVEKRRINPSIESEVAWEQNRELVDAVEAGMRGQPIVARLVTARVLEKEPGNIDAWRYAYEVCLQTADWAGAGDTATSLLDLYIQKGERLMAKALIEEASAYFLADATPRFCRLAGAYLEKEHHWEKAMAFYEASLAKDPGGMGGLRALLRLGEIQRELGNPWAARDYIDRARSHPDYADQWREVIDESQREIERAFPRGVPEMSRLTPAARLTLWTQRAALAQDHPPARNRS
jgi:membrane associated rhomboid family serine protease